MNTNINKSFKSKVITLISAAIVISFFAIPTVGIFCSKDGIIESENRKMYQFPEFSFKKKAYKSFLDGFSKFLEDRYLFRFSLNSFVEPIYNRHFFKGVDVNSKNGIMLGLHNWLFSLDKSDYKTHSEDVPFDIIRQTFIANRIKKVQSLAGNVPTYVIVCPDKIGVYPEYALPWVGKPGKFRLADKKIKFLRDQGIQVFDNLELMLEHKKDGLLYYLSDTHWNYYAAFLAFENNIGQILGDKYVKKLYKFSRYIRPSGDLGNGYAGYKNESEFDGVNVSLDNPDDITVKLYKTLDSPIFEALKKELSDKPEKILINHLDVQNYIWDQDVYESINKSAPIKKTVVVYCDSFTIFNGYRIFLEGQFKHVVFLHFHVLNAEKAISEQIITKFKPDLILYESVERNL